MHKHLLTTIKIILIIFYLSGQCYTQTNYYSTISNSRIRPLAMGGAFTAVKDNLASIHFNPANFSLYNNKDFRITLFCNPLASFMAFKYYSDDFHQEINKKNMINSSALLIKAVVFTISFLQTGFIFGEESLKNISKQNNSKFFYGNDLWNNSAHTFFTSFKLAERLSLGFSSTYYHQKDKNDLQKGFGFSYGIMLKPWSNVNVGLAYIDLPEKASDFRSILERIEDETMNIGISYEPTSSTILSLDVRNLTEDSKKNVRELHLGFEQSIYKISSIRFGFFREIKSSFHGYSAGIGLFDSNIIRKSTNHFNHHNFLINYSFIYQNTDLKYNHWHLFSFILPI